MKQYDSEIFKELIGLTTEKLKLSHPYVIEKDYYVTQAIALVTQIPHESFDLVFQGGTCLAKAHRIIKRMSEDCDFRMRLKPDALPMRKEAKRKSLRSFRNEIIDRLRKNGYIIEPENIRVRNEGQFMSVRASYPSLYPIVNGIKPFLALEFFLGEVKVPTEIKPVTTLIKQVLGDISEHATHDVNSMAIVETAAEKWVALTRRIANSHLKNRRDPSLVRHLYDLYQIENHKLFTNDFELLTCKIVDDDRIPFKNHNENYFQDPSREIERAMTELSDLKIWEDYWYQFLEVMVYGDIKPDYQAVLENLRKITRKVLDSLQKRLEISEITLQ